MRQKITGKTCVGNKAIKAKTPWPKFADIIN